MLATHQDAERRYTVLRESVIDEVNRDLAQSPDSQLKAALITADALIQSKQWSKSSKRRVDWDWSEGYSAFRFRYPKRFELALWHRNSLISLSLGRPTYFGTKVRLDFIEASPHKPSDIRVFEPTFIAMAAYAQLIGANELRVMNPINEEVKRYYASFGFTYVRNGDYLFIRL